MKPDQYEVYDRFSKSIERWIIRGLCLLGVLLMLAQTILRIPVLRDHITAIDRLEGIPFDYRTYVPVHPIEMDAN